jgi:hypothetical protein
MTLQIPNGFGQAVAQFGFTLGQSNPMAMVFGYSNLGSADGPTNATSIGDRIDAIFGGTGFTDQVIFQQLSVLQNPGSETGLATYSTPGGNNSPSFPPNTCLLVHKTSSTGGRQGRGRMYWPSLATADANEAGVINPASLPGFQTLMTGLITQLGLDLTPMVILHTSVATSPSLVTALVVDPIAATQRRRMRS